MPAPLPIDAALPELLDVLAGTGRAVLQAPPGAGKTTRVPLAMLEAELTEKRIVMLEPRRLAARAAAERMAETLGEPVGRTVGYRMRGATKVSSATRIEVLTEGVLTRMIQADPGLDGIGAVLFDEFHERSLNADLGLALVWEARSALRPDLLVLVMSATLEAEPVAKLLDNAPVVTARGQSYAVETRWLDRPMPGERVFEAAAADLVAEAVAATEGGVLVFLPGAPEIRRVSAALGGRLPPDAVLNPLYGTLRFAEQRAAILPATSGRKVVLATSIAETSLTIEDVRVVVDCGRARRARFDPRTGMSALMTERVTRAEADQRRGRAGRVAQGVCYRMWARAEEGALAPYPPAEIEAADLTGLVLDLALWGAGSADGLAFLTPPPDGAWAEARILLRGLGALDDEGRITDHGRRLAALPLHPRLAHMLAVAGPDAAPVAALLSERDPLRNGPVDLSLRVEALADPGRFVAHRGLSADRGVLARLRDETRRLRRAVDGIAPRRHLSLGQQTALAYPDRVGLRRRGDAPRWILSGGRGATMDGSDPLAGAQLIVATDLDGAGTEARVRQAVELIEAELREVHGNAIEWQEVCEWSRRERRVLARRQERFGALVLSDQIWPDVPPDLAARAMLDGVRQLGLPWDDASRRLAARVELLRAEGAELPEFTEPALLAAAEDWLLPQLSGIRSADEFKRLDLAGALRRALGWDAAQTVDRLAPAQFETPLGRRVPLDYTGGAPEISIRLQEMFGVTEHPVVGPRRLPVKVTLLSPAGRPLQTTTDLPGFWASSYQDVRKDMRGRYPKHPWPDDPASADPTLRAKPRR